MHVLGTFQDKKRKRKKTRLLLSLLGRETSETLGVLRVGLPSVVGSLSEKPECNEKYKSLYSGLGKLTLHVKHNVKPVIRAARRILFSLRSKVEELEALGITEQAEGPTSFVSPVVVVPKPNS